MDADIFRLSRSEGSPGLARWPHRTALSLTVLLIACSDGGALDTASGESAPPPCTIEATVSVNASQAFPFVNRPHATVVDAGLLVSWWGQDRPTTESEPALEARLLSVADGSLVAEATASGLFSDGWAEEGGNLVSLGLFLPTQVGATVVVPANWDDDDSVDRTFSVVADEASVEVQEVESILPSLAASFGSDLLTTAPGWHVAASPPVVSTVALNVFVQDEDEDDPPFLRAGLWDGSSATILGDHTHYHDFGDMGGIAFNAAAGLVAVVDELSGDTRESGEPYPGGDMHVTAYDSLGGGEQWQESYEYAASTGGSPSVPIGILDDGTVLVLEIAFDADTWDSKPPYHPVLHFVRDGEEIHSFAPATMTYIDSMSQQVQEWGWDEYDGDARIATWGDSWLLVMPRGAWLGSGASDGEPIYFPQTGEGVDQVLEDFSPWDMTDLVTLEEGRVALVHDADAYDESQQASIDLLRCE